MAKDTKSGKATDTHDNASPSASEIKKVVTAKASAQRSDQKAQQELNELKAKHESARLATKRKRGEDDIEEEEEEEEQVSTEASSEEQLATQSDVPVDAETVGQVSDGVTVEAAERAGLKGLWMSGDQLSWSAVGLTAAAVGGGAVALSKRASSSSSDDAQPVPRSAPTLAKVLDASGDIQGDVAKGASTDDPRPQVRVELGGTSAVAGDQLQLRDGTTLLGSHVLTQVDISAGFVLISPDADLVDGQSYGLTARLVDAAGIVGADSDVFSLVADRTPPGAPLLTKVLDAAGDIQGDVAEGVSTDDPRPQVRVELGGTGAVAGDQVQLRDGSTLLGSHVLTQADIDAGFVLVVPDADLVDGQAYGLTARLVDAAGNAGADSDVFSLVADRTPPGAPLLAKVLDAAGDIQGDVAEGVSTDDPRPQVRVELGGTGAVAGDQVQLRDGTTLLGSHVLTQADIDAGFVLVVPDADLVDGQAYGLTARLVDAAGNAGADSDVFSLVADRTPPGAPLLAKVLDAAGDIQGDVAEGVSTDDPRPQVRVELGGTGAVAGDQVQLRDGTTLLGSHVLTQADIDAGFVLVVPDADLVDGQAYGLTARLVDAAGNAGADSDVFSLVADRTPPGAPLLAKVLDAAGDIQGDVAEGVSTDDPRPQVRVELGGTGAVAGDQVQLRDGTTLLGSHVLTQADIDAGFVLVVPDADLVDGQTYGLSARLVDVAGNAGADSDVFSLVADRTAPSAPLVVTQPVGYMIEAVSGQYAYPRDVRALSADGSFVVAWEEEDGQFFRSYVQKFDASGAPVGAKIALGDVNVQDANEPRISSLGTDGSFAVTWRGDDGTSDNIYVQKFDSSGVAVGAKTVLEGVSGRDDDSPRISSLGTDGSFAVAWRGNDGTSTNIYVQKFDANGMPAGARFLLQGVNGGDDREPQITSLGTDGSFAVVWKGDDATSDNIYVLKVNANGTIAGPKQVLEGVNGLDDWDPQITSLGTDGSFAVTWTGSAGTSDNIYVQKFGSSGVSAAPMIKLEGVGDRDVYSPKIAPLGTDGSFAVTWVGNDDISANIYVQKFDTSGLPTSAKIMLEGVAGGEDESPQIASLGADGSFAVTWIGNDGTSDNIYVQKFDSGGVAAAPKIKLEGVSGERDTSPKIVSVGTDGSFVVAWEGYDYDGTVHSAVYVQKFGPDGSPIENSASGVTTESGKLYLVRSDIIVTGLEGILSAADSVWNVMDALPGVHAKLDATGLQDGSYMLYAADLAGNLSAAGAQLITVNSESVILA